MVEIWVQCPPFKIEVNGESEYESEYMLFKAHKKLMRHFSPQWKKELAEYFNATRIHVPFSKQPVKMIVGWMMAGGGNALGTATDPYPNKQIGNLQTLKRLAVYLKIDPLIQRLTTDIEAITPILPARPAPKVAPKPVTPIPPQLCWYCNKAG